MGETEDANACGASEGIKRRRLHFDGKNALVSRRLNGVGGFAERRVRRPARADNAARPCPCERRGSHSHQIGVGVGELGRRSVVIARALVAQRAVDHHEIAWGPDGVICPAEVRLTSSWHPLANNSSATRTAKGAPTARPTIPTRRPQSRRVPYDSKANPQRVSPCPRLA